MQDGHVYEPTSLWVPVIDATDGSRLPTPRAAMGDARNSRPWLRPLDKPQNLENAIARTPISLLPTPTARDYKDTGKNTNYQRQADKKLLAGVIMVQRSDDGDTSSDGQPPPQ